jgi:hypothetical protein
MGLDLFTTYTLGTIGNYSAMAISITFILQVSVIHTLVSSVCYTLY